MALVYVDSKLITHRDQSTDKMGQSEHEKRLADKTFSSHPET